MAPINRTATKVTLNMKPAVKKTTICSENYTIPGKTSFSKRKADSPTQNRNVKRPALNTINNLQLINNVSIFLRLRRIRRKSERKNSKK